MSQHCCHTNSSDKDHSQTVDSSIIITAKRRTMFKRIFDSIRCVVPGAVLILLPKCPVCMAAWISVATGFGITVSAAGYLRISMIIVCVATLLYFVVRRLKAST